MARRRRRRRNPINPINKQDWTPIIIGALGGAAALYLYLKPQLASAATAPVQNTTITTPAGSATLSPATGQ